MEQCERWVSAPVGKGITLNFTGLSSVINLILTSLQKLRKKARSCSDATIEVYEGYNTDKPLVTLCSTSELNSIVSSRVSALKIKLSMKKDAIPEGVIFGSWNTKDCKIT